MARQQARTVRFLFIDHFPTRMVIPYGMVEAQWWDSHFLSLDLDYGFGKSSASAHLHVRTQDGRIKTVGEFVAPHLPAYEFAGEVVRNLVAPQTQGQRRKIVAVYLDPANFKNRRAARRIARPAKNSGYKEAPGKSVAMGKGTCCRGAVGID